MAGQEGFEQAVAGAGSRACGEGQKSSSGGNELRPVQILKGFAIRKLRLWPQLSFIKLPQRLFIDLQALGICQDTGVRAQR
jgi:hypothetical protein